MGGTERTGRGVGRRAVLVSALVLLLSALIGEVSAPIRVLPLPLTVLEIVLVGGGLYALMWATGGAMGYPRTGRGFRIAAVVVVAPIPYAAMGPRHVLLVLLVYLYVVLAGGALALACLIGLWWRPRDAGVALLVLALGVGGGALAANASDDVRLRLLAGRLRSEAAAVGEDPPDPWGYGETPVGRAFPLDEASGVDADEPPAGAAWIWTRTIGPDAEPHALLYAPGRRIDSYERLTPAVDSDEGAPLSCRTSPLDDFYWCFLE